MRAPRPPDDAVEMLREVIVTLVRRDVPSLSAHQLGVFLACYLSFGEPSIAGLSETFGLSHTAVSRVVDKLDDRGLTRRREGEIRPAVFVEQTETGQAMLKDLRAILVQIADPPDQVELPSAT